MNTFVNGSRGSRVNLTWFRSSRCFCITNYTVFENKSPTITSEFEVTFDILGPSGLGLLLTWKKRSIWGWRLTIGSLTGSTSLKQMIVTAAQAIMRHTLTMKKKCRNLSRREHSGNLQWEIWKKITDLEKREFSSKKWTYHKLFVAQILILAQFTTWWTTPTSRGNFQPFLPKKEAMILDTWSISLKLK